VSLWIVGKYVLGSPFVVVVLIWKWRKKHQSIYDTVEDFQGKTGQYATEKL
jgi:hypothetical protein